jgi:hypothetical protein
MPAVNQRQGQFIRVSLCVCRVLLCSWQAMYYNLLHTGVWRSSHAKDLATACLQVRDAAAGEGGKVYCHERAVMCCSVSQES